MLLIGTRQWGMVYSAHIFIGVFFVAQNVSPARGICGLCTDFCVHYKLWWIRDVLNVRSIWSKNGQFGPGTVEKHGCLKPTVLAELLALSPCFFLGLSSLGAFYYYSNSAASWEGQEGSWMKNTCYLPYLQLGPASSSFFYGVFSSENCCLIRIIWVYWVPPIHRTSRNLHISVKTLQLNMYFAAV